MDSIQFRKSGRQDVSVVVTGVQKGHDLDGFLVIT